MFAEMPCICIPFLSNNTFHQSETNVLGLYLCFSDGSTQYLNFSHPDKLVDPVTLSDIKLHKHSLVLHKKHLLYHSFDEGIDLQTFVHYVSDEILDVTLMYSKTMEIFYQRFRKNSNVGSIVPLSKLIEYAMNTVLAVLPYFTTEQMTDECIEYCDDFINTFHSIEVNDIHIDDGIKKQNYMWLTSTSRPSNTWDNFNISALNKTDGSRMHIHSKFDGGKLVQFDYDAFHVKLLAKALNYEFKQHPYIELQEDLGMYVGYDKMKSAVFQNLYGGITTDFAQHPFFEQIQTVIDNMYMQYLERGYIESWYYGKRFYDIPNASPNKVFNYVIQSLETEHNLALLKTLLPMLAGQKTVLSMYLYDAFIFDVHPDEMWLVPKIKEIMESDGMTVKISIGDTFGSMNETLDDIYMCNDTQIKYY